MRFEKTSDTEARVVGLDETEAKKALKQYHEKKDRYVFKTPTGNLALDLDFKPEAIGIKVHRRPGFVPSWLMWQKMEEMIRKANIKEKSTK